MSVKILKGKHFTFVLHISSFLLNIIKWRHNNYLNNVDALTTCCIRKNLLFQATSLYQTYYNVLFIQLLTDSNLFTPLFFFVIHRNKYNLFFAIATLILTSAVNFANILLIIVIISAINFSWEQLALWSWTLFNKAY